MRVPVELLRRAAQELLRLKIIDLDRIRTAILKQLEQPPRVSLRLQRLHGGTA